jgi:hypothetical protein
MQYQRPQNRAEPVININGKKWKFRLDQRYPELWGRYSVDRTLEYKQSVFVGCRHG